MQQHVHLETDYLYGKIGVKYDTVRLWPLSKSDKLYERCRLRYEQSKLPEGSWTVLYSSVEWIDCTEVSPKQYTISKSDRLRQLATIVDFRSLSRLSLDLGALPNRMGLKNPKTDEHRALSGTVLLTNQMHEPVLVVATRENDDDLEALALKLSIAGVEKLPKYGYGIGIESFCHYTRYLPAKLLQAGRGNSQHFQQHAGRAFTTPHSPPD